jgi:hypothetical protein
MQELFGVCLEGEITHEGIDRLLRVKLKRDANGLEGRLKPSVFGACWFTFAFGCV